MLKRFRIKKKYGIQLQTAQLPAGQQIDNRVDKKLAGLDAKVKSIIKDTVKSQFIKKEAISVDPSLLENELTYEEEHLNLRFLFLCLLHLKEHDNLRLLILEAQLNLAERSNKTSDLHI